jgi:plasmid stabilization system protein ParE
LATEFKDAVDQMVERIAAASLRFGPVRGEIRRALLRRFPYAIHFVPEPNAIIILAVFHTKRDPRHLEGRS